MRKEQEQGQDQDKNNNVKAGNEFEAAPGTAMSARGSRGARRRDKVLRRTWWFGVVAGVVLVVLLESACVAWAQAGGIGQVRSFASRLTNYVTAVAASVAVLFMAINGVRWTMSSGNPARQAEAKNGLLSAAAGLAIALSAGLIVNLVVAALR